MRLAAQAKMGYYPTPPMVVSLITGILVRNGPGKIRIFDPCAGEGHALKEIKDSLQCESYGIEPDTQRGKIARQNLTRCLITDYENSRISNPISGNCSGLRQKFHPVENGVDHFIVTWLKPKTAAR